MPSVAHDLPPLKIKRPAGHVWPASTNLFKGDDTVNLLANTINPRCYCGIMTKTNKNQGGFTVKDLGKLILTPNDESSFKVNLYVTPSEIIYSLGRADNATNAFVTVQYSGVYAGTVEQQNQYIFNQVEGYLYSKGYLDRVESATMFRDYDYVPSQKLLDAVK